MNNQLVHAFISSLINNRATSLLLQFVVLMALAVIPSEASAQSRRVNEPHGEKCAEEGGICFFQGTRDVYYGVNGTGGQPDRWVVQSHAGAARCDNSTFGDPAVGIPKSCYVVGGSRVVALAAKAMNLVVKSPQDGFSPITCSECDGTDAQIKELFGPNANASNTRFRTFHDYGFWRMTFFVASHQRPDGFVSSIISFRGTDDALQWSYQNVEFRRLRPEVVTRTLRTHDFLNGLVEPLVGQPYAGRSGGVESLAAAFGKADLLEHFNFLTLRQATGDAVDDVPGPNEFDERFDLTVHPGWASAALTVIDEVENELERGLAEFEQTRNNQRVLITGHSMGGAVATYLSYLLLDSGELGVQSFLSPSFSFGALDHNLVTFGSPRINVGRTVEPTKIFLDEGLDELISSSRPQFRYQFVEIFEILLKDPNNIREISSVRDNVPHCWEEKVDEGGGSIAFDFRPVINNVLTIPPVNSFEGESFGGCTPNRFHDSAQYYNAILDKLI
ncbi:hypothetical protein IQ260_30060 [Leptolyngbya cf. ectocarpi LEGE 11479]|uniref:Fungal lipase-type domain-containing protein n=1 Tax=Leptolyngbya cf. ectocarpi LEGE 11479 TaxID=1828722 RepID=A0A929A0M0_LEPEC|nr:hypothetical protein [Leptolyngbya ectocarpi]MBE9070885.1 hypothetical protein [Leptolyngbya cf. ectocarpi LEGE 11479]